jgi:hypothetical protein
LLVYLVVASALTFFASTPAVYATGRLDLDLYGSQNVQFTGGAVPMPGPPTSSGIIWVPRDMRDEPKSVQVIAATGYTAMGAVGAAQAMCGAGSSRAAKAESAGFMTVALVSFWRLLKTLWN